MSWSFTLKLKGRQVISAAFAHEKAQLELPVVDLTSNHSGSFELGPGVFGFSGGD